MNDMVYIYILEYGSCELLRISITEAKYNEFETVEDILEKYGLDSKHSQWMTTDKELEINDITNEQSL